MIFQKYIIYICINVMSNILSCLVEQRRKDAKIVEFGLGYDTVYPQIPRMNPTNVVTYPTIITVITIVSKLNDHNKIM